MWKKSPTHVMTAGLGASAILSVVAAEQPPMRDSRPPAVQPPIAEQAGGVAGGAPSPLETCCALPFPIPSLLYHPAPFSTAGAGPVSPLCFAPCNDEPVVGCFGTQADPVWYSFTAPEQGFIRIDTSGSTYDTAVEVFTPGCVQAAVMFFQCEQVSELITCDDNDGTDLDAFLEASVQGGEMYLIRVTRNSGPSGVLDFNFTFSGNDVPANDDCNAAEIIPAAAEAFDFDPDPFWTSFAGGELCEAAEGCEFLGLGVSNSVWYRFTPVVDGTIDVHTNGSSYDTVLSIFTGCGSFNLATQQCNSPPTQLACDDNSGIGSASRIDHFPVQAGVTYRIKVADLLSAPGGGTLNFNLSFEPDGCESDLNGDGQVDGADLGQVLLDWGGCG